MLRLICVSERGMKRNERKRERLSHVVFVISIWSLGPTRAAVALALTLRPTDDDRGDGCGCGARC